MKRKFQECFKEVYRVFQGGVKDVSQNFQGSFSGCLKKVLSNKTIRNMIFREYPCIIKVFNYSSSDIVQLGPSFKFKGCYMEISRMFKESLWVLRESFKSVSRNFTGRFKENFQGSFKGV